MATAALADVLSWVLMVPALVRLWQEVRGRGATPVGLGAWVASSACSVPSVAAS